MVSRTRRELVGEEGRRFESGICTYAWSILSKAMEGREWAATNVVFASCTQIELEVWVSSAQLIWSPTGSPSLFAYGRGCRGSTQR